MKWIPPKSPYNLIQEQLWEDPWKIFVACIFCNLTKRVQAEPIFWECLRIWPKPEDLAAADIKRLQDLIKPLGLVQRRARALKMMSNDYLIKDWRSHPETLYGVGKYASDAYRIFCIGDWRNVTPKDHALNDYHNFLSKKLGSINLIGH